MRALSGRKGLLILGIVIVIVFIAAIVTYQATGPMGIEERFNAAAGLRTDAGEEDGGSGGFSIEGNAVLYALILAALAAACVAMYRHFRL
jgi:hypothetical protein